MARVIRLLNAISMVFLAFLLGFISGGFRLWPYDSLFAAASGIHAIYYSYIEDDGLPSSGWWYPARTANKGVTIKKPDRIEGDLTLFATGHSQSAQLIDLDGNLIHEWRMPYSQVWQSSPTIPDAPSDEQIYWRQVRMFPNGDLLVVCEGKGLSPYGFGIFKLDRDSQVIWSFFEQAHHDVDVAPDGRIYALTHRIREDPIAGAPNIRPPIIADSVAILSSDGDLLESIDILDALANSEFRNFIDTLPHTLNRDIMHANAVRFVDRPTAEAYPFLNEGDIFLSIREAHALAAMDRDTRSIKWMLRGPWQAQHDPDLLENGRILLFDNLWQANRSRVVEVDPVRLSVKWSYAGDKDNSLWSTTRSSQQRLAGGNTLITESESGRLLEISQDGDIVWEYVHPDRAGETENWIPSIHSASRHHKSDVTFLAEALRDSE